MMTFSLLVLVVLIPSPLPRPAQLNRALSIPQIWPAPFNKGFLSLSLFLNDLSLSGHSTPFCSYSNIRLGLSGGEVVISNEDFI